MRKLEQDTLCNDAAACLVRYRSGSDDALAELVHLLTPTLWHLVRACGLDRHTAEDVVQTTWLKLVNHADSIEQPEAVLGWLATTARREAWRVKRKAAQTAPVEPLVETWESSDEAPDAGLLRASDAKELWQAMSRLPERCQRLLRIVALTPRPDYQIVSEQMQMPVGSIGPTRGRCLEKLRSELTATGGL